MICQAPGKDIGQFCQEAETTLSRFDALFFELLVQGLDNVGDLQFEKEIQKHTHQSLGFQCTEQLIQLCQWH